ncbi:hypothetical protein BX600DRAFT_130381 [Xylariales sp. PMI_506]|nr:hypothetical protein BX600DRAFT_130381 [Xylariales sp. PMI_506]
MRSLSTHRLQAQDRTGRVSRGEGFRARLINWHTGRHPHTYIQWQGCQRASESNLSDRRYFCSSSIPNWEQLSTIVIHQEKQALTYYLLIHHESGYSKVGFMASKGHHHNSFLSRRGIRLVSPLLLQVNPWSRDTNLNLGWSHAGSLSLPQFPVPSETQVVKLGPQLHTANLNILCIRISPNSITVRLEFICIPWPAIRRFAVHSVMSRTVLLQSDSSPLISVCSVSKQESCWRR